MKITKKDVKPVLDWAKDHGDANIYDRILVKVMPQLVQNDIMLTSESIQNSKTIDIPEDLYILIKEKSEELIGSSFKQ